MDGDARRRLPRQLRARGIGDLRRPGQRRARSEAARESVDARPRLGGRRRVLRRGDAGAAYEADRRRHRRPLLHRRQRRLAAGGDQLQRPRRHRRRRARALGHAGAVLHAGRTGRRGVGLPADAGPRVIAARLLAGSCLCCLLSAAPAFAQATHLLVITGVAGDEEHGAQFQKWATSFIDAAKKKDAVADANIILLADRKATREGVEKAFSDIAARARPNEAVVVLLIGHGSFNGTDAAFNLPGPDLTVADWSRLLA